MKELNQYICFYTSVYTFTQVQNVLLPHVCPITRLSQNLLFSHSGNPICLSVRLSVRLRAKGSLDCVTHFSADSTKGKFNTVTIMLTDISISEILAGHSSVSPELFHFSFFLPLLVVCDENPLSVCVLIAGTNYGDKMSSFSSSVYLTFQSWPRSYDDGNKSAAVGTHKCHCSAHVKQHSYALRMIQCGELNCVYSPQDEVWVLTAETFQVSRVIHPPFILPPLVHDVNIEASSRETLLRGFCWLSGKALEPRKKCSGLENLNHKYIHFLS